MLKRTLGAGALALVPGLACGNDDADVFASTGGDTADGSTLGPTSTSIGDPETTTTAAATSQSVAETQPDPDPDTGSLAVPAGTEFVISFTYEQTGGGKDEPPYVAVWIEDADGELIETVELWHLQRSKGSRWLPDLRRWFNVDQARIDVGGADTVDVVSSATRLPGSYSVVWDGSAEAGALPAGNYFVCIESVREKGPYSLIREPVVLDGAGFELALPDEEELVDVSVALSV